MLGLDSFSATILFFLAGSAFIAGLGRGFSGFGSALIFVPLASAVTGPAVAAPLLLVIDAVASAGLIPNAWRLSDKRETGVMAFGALIGVPVGTWVLGSADPTTVRWMIVGIIVALLGLVVSGWRYRGRPAPAMTIGVGAVSGVLNGIAQVGGPPAVAYWLGSPRSTPQVRANLIFLAALTTLITIATYSAGGLFTWAVFALAVVTGPVYALGMWIGTRMFGLASEETFRRICYGLIGIAAVISLPILDRFLR